MCQFLQGIQRNTCVVNLDPANDFLPYECAVDLKDLVTLESVMEHYSLGPNGGLLFCVEFLEKNLDWLVEKLKALPKGIYVLFDCPGQVELYTHHDSMKNIFKILSDNGWRLTCVHLVDSHHCSSVSNYLSALTLSLSTMLQLELPHVNVLSKIDLLSKYGTPEFDFAFYADADNLSDLQYALGQDVSEKYKKLTATICEIVEDFSLVSFTTLNIQDKQSITNALYLIDKANGYHYTGTISASAVIKSVDLDEINFDYYRVGQIQERYYTNDSTNEATN
eukprot:TRINITY_DN11657_c0_g1_i3.p1 TRINITY_DN11657_c0_g1~~TRINITY_DN11657_c0_g1_i3.p1  ORF type:complete len:279 (+),score=55.63 TRINITY_DN11657_c0_g1_i3:181-1017(+)